LIRIIALIRDDSKATLFVVFVWAEGDTPEIKFNVLF